MAHHSLHLLGSSIPKLPCSPFWGNACRVDILGIVAVYSVCSVVLCLHNLIPSYSILHPIPSVSVLQYMSYRHKAYLYSTVLCTYVHFQHFTEAFSCFFSTFQHFTEAFSCFSRETWEGLGTRLAQCYAVYSNNYNTTMPWIALEWALPI